MRTRGKGKWDSAPDRLAPYFTTDNFSYNIIIWPKTKFDEFELNFNKFV